jgi:hypothetical protein
MNVPMSRILHSGKNSLDTCPILRSLWEYSSAEIKKKYVSNLRWEELSVANALTMGVGP